MPRRTWFHPLDPDTTDQGDLGPVDWPDEPLPQPLIYPWALRWSLWMVALGLVLMGVRWVAG